MVKNLSAKSLIFSSVFALSTILAGTLPSFAMDDPEVQSLTKTYRSPNQLPKNFSLSTPKIAEFNRPQLDEFTLSKKRNEAFFAAWDPDQIKENGFLIVEGSRFLDFSPESFKNYSMGLYNPDSLDSQNITQKNLILAPYWDTYTRSASLVTSSYANPPSPYGYVLEIPPQLILRLYPQDATTAMISQRLDNPVQFMQQYVVNHQYMVDINYMPTPPNFLSDSVQHSKNWYNEIKFVPQGNWQGKEYSVAIRGFYIKDDKFEDASKIEAMAKDLNLEIFYLNRLQNPIKTHETKILNMPMGLTSLPYSSSHEVISPEEIPEAKDQWGRPMSHPNFGMAPQ